MNKPYKPLPEKPKDYRSLIRWYATIVGAPPLLPGPPPGSMLYNARMKMNEKLEQRLKGK